MHVPQPVGQVGHASAAPLKLLLLLSLRLARGWAPAVVLAQGVRLVGSVVQQRENKDEAKAGREGTEVRALQLGLSVVPRVDPRMPRSLADYCTIYREWLLLLRGRLAQAGVDLPEALFAEGPEGDEELMRFALCYNILQARSLKDALVAMDRTMSNIKEFAAWHAKYSFIPPGDLAAWQRIAWWEGPDAEGHLWLMIDFRAAVSASRTHGPELVARVLVSNMEYGVRQLIGECHCASTLRVVVDTSGVHIGTTLRNRGVFQRVGHVMDRMYPCRLQVLYMVGLPFPLRWTFKACLQLLHVHTRKKIRMCRVTDVPRRLPSQLRSHKLSAAAGLDSWAFLETASYGDGLGLSAAGTVADSVVESGAEEPFTPHSVRAPMTPRMGPQNNRRGLMRWRRGRAGGAENAAVHGSGFGGWGSSSVGRRRGRLSARLVVGGLLVVGGAAVVLYLLLLQWLAPRSSRQLLGQLARAVLLRLNIVREQLQAVVPTEEEELTRSSTAAGVQ